MILMRFGKERPMDVRRRLDFHKSKGHLIGLHSYSHPTQMSKLSKEKQELEYQNNYDHLTGLISKPIKVMSHHVVTTTKSL